MNNVYGEVQKLVDQYRLADPDTRRELANNNRLLLGRYRERYTNGDYVPPYQLLEQLSNRPRPSSLPIMYYSGGAPGGFFRK